MQVIFFFLCLILILAFTPYPVLAEVVFDGAKMKGGVRVKLFGAFTVFRAVAAIEDRVLKIHTKKDRYIFIEILEALAGGSPAASPKWLFKAISFDEISIITEYGDPDNAELAMLTGGLINALSGTLYAAVKNLSPETRINVTHTAVSGKDFRIYAKSIISARPADIIRRYIKRKKHGTTTKSTSN